MEVGFGSAVYEYAYINNSDELVLSASCNRCRPLVIYNTIPCSNPF